MRSLLRYVCVIILWMITIVSNAGLIKSMFDIRHIGYAEGLGSQRVFSIVEDKDAVVWIATKIGISRYNGQAVKSYSLPGNFHYSDMAGRRIRLLYDERSGLWAYDNTGRLYLYSIQNDCFEQNSYLGEYINGEIILNKIYIDHKGTLWMGLSNGLYKKEANESVVCVIPNQYVNDIVSSEGFLFAGTSKGVVQIPFSQLDKATWIINEKDVQTLFYDVIKKELWIGTVNNGLWIMNMNTSALSQLKEQISSFFNPIRAIVNYDAHTILVGIDGGGVYAVDAESKKSHLLMSTEDNTDIFLHGNGIYAITKDHQGNIWIGSYSGGVSVAIPSRYPITLLTHERGNKQSLANNNINDIEENTNGDLWFASDDGISILNALTQTWTHCLKENVIVTLCQGDNGFVWAGTYGDGVYLLNSKGDIVRHITKQQGILNTNYIFSIRQDIDKNVWVGGLDGNLLVMNKDGRHKKSYDIKWIHSIEEVSKDLIAIATVNGFFLLNKHTGDIQQHATFQKLQGRNASAYIVSMLFNGDDTVWLGTEGGGLNLYNMRTKEVRTFTTQNGLPSDDVYSLQQDPKGRLWISTGKGLALLDNLQVSNLNYIGNIEKEYNKSSFARLKDGRFSYGSTNGAVFVTPAAVAITNYDAPLRFTAFTVEYLGADEEKRLRPVIYGMLHDGLVQLDYKQNSFSIDFESINYRFQRDIVYQYILEGYEKSWNSSSQHGSVRYTNVSPGSYLLKVRSLRRSDGEIISEKTLMLNISQPWWNSWWAWLCYVAIAGIIFYFILRYNSNRLQKKYDEDKIRFFIDTAHDIRTPVTLIMAPLEDLSKEKGLPEKVLYLLDLARNNTHKLYTLTTQLLEFEKVDVQKKQPALSPFNLNDIIAEEAVNFQPFCDKKQLHLSLSLPDEDIYALADKYLLEILLDNLLSNACKYTMPGGSICLTLTSTKHNAIIEVKDNGIGIPKKSRKFLFTDVHRAENARKSQEGGVGFGLLQVYRIVKKLHGRIDLQSEENKGTTFTINLKRANVDATSIPKQMIEQTKTQYSEVVDMAPRNNDKIENNSKQENKNTLLIVEDHETLRYYLHKTFENDYQVVSVSDGEEALSFLSTNYPDLILSDVMMPGIQGDELCRLVKNDPNTSGIPFILLTAKVNHDATVEGLKKGADDYIPKPFNTEILKLKVQSFIENRNRQRDFFMRQVIKQVGADKYDANRVENEVISETDEIPINVLSENDRRFVVQATEFIIENISDIDFNINSLCQEMAMSRTLFYSRLKSLTGKGPQEFIRIIRLQKAAELLKEGKTVTEVAINTGFINTKYFSMLFNKHFGIQPIKYEKND